LSTDDEEIATVGREWGLEVPFLRPPELATDETPTVPVLRDVIQRLEASGETYDAVFTLSAHKSAATCRGYRWGDIAMLESTGADSVISFVEVGDKHPARMKFIDEDGRVSDPPFAEQFEGQPRQSLPRLWLREGSVYLTRRDVLMLQGSIKGNRLQSMEGAGGASMQYR